MRLENSFSWPICQNVKNKHHKQDESEAANDDDENSTEIAADSSAGDAEPPVNRPACSSRENITALISQKVNISESFRSARPRPLAKGQQTNTQLSNSDQKQLPSKQIVSRLNKLSNPYEGPTGDEQLVADEDVDRTTLFSHSFRFTTSPSNAC